MTNYKVLMGRAVHPEYFGSIAIQAGIGFTLAGFSFVSRMLEQTEILTNGLTLVSILYFFAMTVKIIIDLFFNSTSPELVEQLKRNDEADREDNEQLVILRERTAVLESKLEESEEELGTIKRSVNLAKTLTPYSSQKGWPDPNARGPDRELIGPEVGEDSKT